MHKATLLKLGGFVTALCATGALVAITVPATGAYFTSAKSGSLSATSGALTLNVDETKTALNFSGLMPGEPKTQSINYGVNVTSGAVDVWLVFDTTAPTTVAKWAGQSTAYHQFTGGGADPSGLGRYGFFKISDTNGGQAFVSGNLAFADTQDKYLGGNDECSVNVDTGRGGSDAIYTGGAYPSYCGVPSKILLASGLTNGQGGTIDITFGLNGVLQTAQGQYEGTVPFHVVATQHGVPLA